MQEKTLEWINKKYPCKCIVILSQWSRIHSFGFLQGQESMSPSHPTDSVYFPHLTFAAYYLVHCLYEPIESNEHKQVCHVLINEQITPKYSMMISFMAGILSDYIQNKKDLTGSGLLYFWKLLRFPSLAQLSPTRQMMLHTRCLDACKADTEIQSPLKDCHMALISSFKSFLITWIDGSKLEDYACNNGYQIEHRPFDKVIKFHLSNWRYILLHSVIDSYIMVNSMKFKSN
ncbi:hypothetical protein RFI_29115 [Reticulomyxa filosa]|uniref:Uncharacterized protein n=1 Tax=Reticulomyxa filosa TaxID=46433 RepID=X6M5G9_RETFI|nr:hypothetical protein RFI_29115 [Reticulomyxa filosa]|eukprot:ETO08275.1 hypothetical protein RFI_29115 [Reticulomyxa filosa]